MCSCCTDIASLPKEREVLSSLDHPFVVKMHFAFQSDTCLYIIMDFYKGGELHFHHRRDKRFTEARTQIYVAEIVLALVIPSASAPFLQRQQRHSYIFNVILQLQRPSFNFNFNFNCVLPSTSNSTTSFLQLQHLSFKKTSTSFLQLQQHPSFNCNVPSFNFNSCLQRQYPSINETILALTSTGIPALARHYVSGFKA
jgi:hypothetical protein